MKLNINEHIDDLFNILNTFHIVVNAEYYKEQMEYKWNIGSYDMLEDINHQLKEDGRFKHAEEFLGVHAITEPIFNNARLQHESSDIFEYITLQEQQSEDFLVEEIFRILDLNVNDDLFDIIESILTSETDEHLKLFYIKLVQNPKRQMKVFTTMLKHFIPYYEQLKHSLADDYDQFVLWIDPILQNDGLNFLAEHIEFLNLKQYDKIYVNYSLISLVSSQILDDKNITLYIGIMFKKYIDSLHKEDETHIHTNVFKTLSDPTRFEILSLLSKEKLYGQEIAAKLNVSTATVSYHMDFLFSAQLVTMNREDRKIYYMLNKDNLNESIKFLQQHFDI